MQFKDLWATLLRRWYLVLVAVMITIGASSAVVFLVGPTYEAKGSVLLIPPGTTVSQANPSGTLGNPFLSLGGLNQARDIVVNTMASKSVYEDLCNHKGDSSYEQMRVELCKSRPGVSYQATPDFTSSAPVILVTVEADSSTNAVTALHAVMERVPATLTQLQSDLGLRPRAEITSIPLVSDDHPDAVHKTQIRAGIAAGAATLGFGLLLIALGEGLVASKRTPRRARGLATSPRPTSTAENQERTGADLKVARAGGVDRTQPASSRSSQLDHSPDLRSVAAARD
ncbi:hypothetical protein GCM10009841_26220 [Microlunatus panaciterrae]|uniref:Capsular polysaccharide biosynthesis protein n=1 Tax=Microlunatus panaciterrae TaxID=400768 RepID=A0ABS2RHM9_9ACTN|nr:hypothetical protein [Microlunatus panaciterrae]MBM7798495.1 hypothetical protein [Microlunatus panaciterrae]